MQYDASDSRSVMEEIAANGPGDPSQPFFGIEILYGYLWREGLEEGRWRLYHDPSSEDYIEGSGSGLLAERPFLTPSGDTLLYVRHGAEVQLYLGGESRGSQIVGAEAYTDWHTGTMFMAAERR